LYTITIDAIRSNRIRTKISSFLVILVIEIIVVTASIGFLWQMNQLNTLQYNFSTERFNMVQMADKLRQSSDDLTHFARTYVITNNQTYKQQYYETLDIRNGKMPRPLMYESIYWDLNKDIRDKRHPNDKPVALKTLFNNLPYTRDELELLTLSEKNSNDLVNLEIEAFNAMIGKYKDDKNQYTITKKPDQNYAIKLLHSEEYYQAKHKIMNPIDNFMIMLNKRTQEQTDAINEKVKITYILFVISIFILVVANIFIYRFLSKQKAKKLEKEVTLSKTLQTLSMDLEESNRKLKSINQDLGQRVKEEVTKNREKDQQLFETTKMAAIGEMIGNIAHQWRQPLSTISMESNNILVDIELEMLDKNTLKEASLNIIKQTQYLSQTIDTFRDFVKEKKELKEAILQESIDRALHIMSATLQNNFIELQNNINYDDPIKITLIESELSEVIINILNNAKDILLEKNIKDKWIKISLEKTNTQVVITIEDNGGGIADDIMPKIFEPYFTTKHQNQGTGLGLHISYKIIVDSLKGKLYAKNTENGAKFFIELPLIQNYR